MRYRIINKYIASVKPKTIIETGAWNGDRAIQMAREALKYHPVVYYKGFDLFELANKHTDAAEFNVKKHFTMEEVRVKLKRFAWEMHGHKKIFEFDLIRGDTNQTLHESSAHCNDTGDHPADFAFIDGGHSIATIAHDYSILKDCTCIILDDYYTNIPQAKKLKYGCNSLCEQIERKEISEQSDPVLGGGRVHLVIVSR